MSLSSGASSLEEREWRRPGGGGGSVRGGGMKRCVRLHRCTRVHSAQCGCPECERVRTRLPLALAQLRQARRQPLHDVHRILRPLGLAGGPLGRHTGAEQARSPLLQALRWSDRLHCDSELMSIWRGHACRWVGTALSMRRLMLAFCARLDGARHLGLLSDICTSHLHASRASGTHRQTAWSPST